MEFVSIVSATYVPLLKGLDVVATFPAQVTGMYVCLDSLRSGHHIFNTHIPTHGTNKPTKHIR